jgi:hypothetical protein
VTSDPAISDRFLTQFADSQSQRTRLAVGLSVAREGQMPRLTVTLSGYSRRFGSLAVTSDVWHHFAVVYRPLAPASPSGTLSWYLDYQHCGYFAVDGRLPESTLLPPGRALLAIGGRNVAGGKVDRGFAGFLDELRMTAASLEPAEFLHVRRREVSHPVKAEFFGPLAHDFSWTRLPDPAETQTQEALPIAGFPPAYSFSGIPTPRRGWHVARTSRRLALPAGDYAFMLRTRGQATLAVDGEVRLDSRTLAALPFGSPLPPAWHEQAVNLHLDGRDHDYALIAAVDFGTGDNASAAVADNQVVRPEPAEARPLADEAIAAYTQLDAAGKPRQWRLLGSDQSLLMEPYWWLAYRGRMLESWQRQEPERRLKAVQRRDAFWREHHAWAAGMARELPAEEPPAGQQPVDFFIDRKLQQLGLMPASPVDDAAFIRRVTLDLAGRVPTYAETRTFLADVRPNRRLRAIDRLLASPEWADAWVGYWQDLLAENPSILRPTLNNSGAFRYWIHRSFAENKPLDQFASELIMMEGNDEAGGTAGFAQASGNDLPMAMKAHVIGKAFLGIDLKCARCHDAPGAPVTQADLFAFAALLEERPIMVPAQSTLPAQSEPGLRSSANADGRRSVVSSSLSPGQRVEPRWPLASLLAQDGVTAGDALADGLSRPRARLAAIITSPRQTRFADVMVNRLWQRYMGLGLVEPLDEWFERDAASHPDLLAYLSLELVRCGYDAKHVSRLILSSRAYQRKVNTDSTTSPTVGAAGRGFAFQTRRRLSAEQLVDSIYSLAGKPFAAEELNFDPNGTQGFMKLPAPKRAWQCASLANERDRPALALPVNQMIVDVLSAFGWREARSNPLTRGPLETNPLQPLMLANGLMVDHAIRLTEDSGLLPHCLAAATPEALAERLFLCVLSRPPDAYEQAAVAAVLAPDFGKRLTGQPAAKQTARKAVQVDWDRHLQGASTLEHLRAEWSTRQGPPPTVRLSADFRQRAEDVVWTLVNSPEFVLVP